MDSNSELLAHSPRPESNIPEQKYKKHIENVSCMAIKNAACALRYYSGKRSAFINEVKCAAIFHDLGKLDLQNQETLRKNSSKKRLPIHHQDAGAAYLLKIGKNEASILVHSHHKGLGDLLKERERDDNVPPFRDPECYKHTDQNLESYLEKHLSRVKRRCCPNKKYKLKWTGLMRRIALSCLADADHGDTAIHYGKEAVIAPPLRRWKERLASLDKYVEMLSQEEPLSERNIQRKSIYQACRYNDIKENIIACDSPVGTGKTTAVMAHILRCAIENKLRHVIIVLPYTNIIKQSVKVYRKALVLSGEDPKEIVAEHHHQADFDSIEMRGLTTLWKAPITVTTAVQFFETLAGNKPGKLRKLHELPGSAVFIDETHAAIPTKFWPQTWKWLKALASEWKCYFVLGSGSLARFWTFEQIAKPPEKITDLIPQSLRSLSANYENKRVSFHTQKEAFDRQSLVEFVLSKKGPRLLILNTVQSAAIAANEMKKAGHSVMHISTALTPCDRERIVDSIYERLEQKEDKDWTLVATSCVEAGMNFSFRTVFRESFSVAGLIQIGGRANRDGKDETAEVWDLRVQDALFNKLIGIENSSNILKDIFKQNLFEKMSATQIVTEAMHRELMSEFGGKEDPIRKEEKFLNYPSVAEKYRIIDTESKMVVVDRKLIETLEEKRLKISNRDLLMGSVQLRGYKIEALALETVKGFSQIYKWSYKYDPNFLGYMEGILKLIYAGEKNFLFV